MAPAEYANKDELSFSAFHGTSLENGKNIVATHRFQLPTRIHPNLSLGRGVYFWKDDLGAAQEHAYKKFPLVPQCVVEALLTLGVNFDCDDPEDQQELELYMERLAMEMHVDAVSKAQALSILARKKLVDSAKQRRICNWEQQREDVVICMYNMDGIDAPCILWPQQ